MSKPDILMNFAYECSALLLSALQRERPSVIQKQELHDTYNGQVIKRDFRNNFQDPYNLELMDKLLLPLFRTVLAETRRMEMETAVKSAFTAEGIYAIEVLGSVKAMTFEEISQIVHPQSKRPQLRVVGLS